MTKTSAMKRIHELLDDNSFVEVGAYVTARSTDFNMQAQETPGDGVITGYGTIEGALVYVYSQEASVMGGSMGEMHAAKIEKLYHMAMKTGAPVIGLLDCAGLRLQEGIDALNGFGRLYLCQTMASGVIPQIQAVFGTCGGGMAVASAMADFTFMEEKANLFVNAPNAIVSNDTDTSDAKFQSEEAGNVCMTGTEEEILSAIHTLVSVLPANNEDDLSYDECGDDLNRLCEGLESFSGDTAAALALISDDGFYMEMKKAYAPSMVTAFIRLNGTTVGTKDGEYLTVARTFQSGDTLIYDTPFQTVLEPSDAEDVFTLRYGPYQMVGIQPDCSELIGTPDSGWMAQPQIYPEGEMYCLQLDGGQTLPLQKYGLITHQTFTTYFKRADGQPTA